MMAALLWRPDMNASGHIQGLKKTVGQRSTQIMSAVPINMGGESRMFSFVTRVEAEDSVIRVIDALKPQLIDAWVTALNDLPADMIHTRFREQDARHLEDLLTQRAHDIIGDGVIKVHIEKKVLF